MMRFGTFVLDASTGQLTRQGKLVPLQHQPARLLTLLVSRTGQTVTREELRRALWSDDTFVEFETALSVAVMKVRQALGDSASSPRFIETVPKRGYRFLADVRTSDDPTDAPVTAHSSDAARKWRLPWFLALGATVLVAVIGAFVVARRAPSMGTPTMPRTIAVLPFKPLVANARDEVFESGMTASVITKLSQLPRLRVSPMASVRRFAGLDQDPVGAGRALGVEAVLESHVHRTPEQVRVLTRVLRVADGGALWAQEWRMSAADAVDLQRRIAEALADVLQLTLTPATRDALRSKDTFNPDAQEQYFFGRHHLSIREYQRFVLAEEAFSRAITLDPQYARAHAGRALALVSMAWIGGRRGVEVLANAKASALEALRLDDSLAEAHVGLGAVAEGLEYNPDVAERAYLRALSLDDAEWLVLAQYVNFLMNRDRFDEALAINHRYLQLEPTSPLAHRMEAMVLYAARRYKECIVRARKSLELDPRFVTSYDWLAYCLEEQGRYDEAVDAYEAARSVRLGREGQRRADQMRALHRAHGWRAYWAEELGATLKADAADALHQEPRRQRGHATYVAQLYLRVGQVDNALAVLERALEDRDPFLMSLNHPKWDPLRNHPRFQAIRHQTGAPGEPASAR